MLQSSKKQKIVLKILLIKKNWFCPFYNVMFLFGNHTLIIICTVFVDLIFYIDCKGINKIQYLTSLAQNQCYNLVYLFTNEALITIYTIYQTST